tara:strand:- start:473 stop:700 length:228 start_codon:yes stop_codon:yes gene_type:complete
MEGLAVTSGGSSAASEVVSSNGHIKNQICNTISLKERMRNTRALFPYPADVEPFAQTHWDGKSRSALQHCELKNR